MSTLAPLISRNLSRFDPIAGRTTFAPAPRKSATRVAEPMIAATGERADNFNRFVTAFAGGLVFFSVLIF